MTAAILLLSFAGQWRVVGPGSPSSVPYPWAGTLVVVLCVFVIVSAVTGGACALGADLYLQLTGRETKSAGGSSADSARGSSVFQRLTASMQHWRRRLTRAEAGGAAEVPSPLARPLDWTSATGRLSGTPRAQSSTAGAHDSEAVATFTNLLQTGRVPAAGARDPPQPCDRAERMRRLGSQA